jgi:hypothetical protein
MSASSLPEVSSTPDIRCAKRVRSPRADAPGSGLIRIDGYAAVGREYSPPYEKQYPNHQGTVKRRVKRSQNARSAWLYKDLVRAVTHRFHE